ncbi:MAG: hypothetical protein KTR24_06075, partial [Saprospiraceae bacterium]|nr:hypothetical protein [Saprospiraceae bacterium]
LKGSMHLHDPRYLGHQVAVPHMASSMAELIHGVANQPMSIYEMGPMANMIEHEVVDWMLDKVGWRQGGGVLTHGGSLANLHCMLTARAAIAKEAWQQGNPQDLVVLAPEASHYSIARAVGIMGLGQEQVIPLVTNGHEVVETALIENQIRKVKSDGKRIMALVINTCATTTGLYDPIQEVSEVTRAHDIWLHLDSPHGVTAILSEKYRHLMQGIEHADSLVWDAHKMMRTSTLCTAALFKDKDNYHGTFAQKASYLIHEKSTAAFDTIPFQIECTKSGLGPKLFWVLAAEGELGIANFVEQTYDLTRQAYHYLNDRPGFHCPYPPESNILCFTYRDGHVDQLALREKVVASGNYYITSSEIKGKRHLRFVIMNEHSTLETIKNMVQEIDRLGAAM